MDFSFVVIGYNVEKYIERCLDSIRDQTFYSIEIIFVDDGSTDGTAKIVNSICNKDSRVRYVYQNNSGANSARVKGFNLANAPFICFVDSDDYVDKNLVEISLSYLNDKSYDFLVFNYKTFDDNNNKTLNKYYESRSYSGEEFLISVLSEKTPHYIWNKVYKKYFLEHINFSEIPHITMGDDLAANVRMGIANSKVIAIEDSLYFYYVNSESVSRKPTIKHLEILKALSDIEESLNKLNKHEYITLVNFKYFRAFQSYVVRNKYKKSKIQIEIYRAWKARGESINSNHYIQSFMRRKSKTENLFTKLYDLNFAVGYAIARLYGLVRGIKE